MVPLDVLPTDRPFTLGEAAALGVGRDELKGRRFRRLHRGVYVRADVVVDLRVRLAALLLVLPGDAVVSHLSAARTWGFEPGGDASLHASTNTLLRSRLPDVRLHRRRGRLHPYGVGGLPVTGPDRTFVDCATLLGLVTLVQLAEHLVHQRRTTVDALVSYCWSRHLDGVVRARRAVAFVREGVESPMESVLRLMLVFARLPEPLVNAEVRDGDGRFVARVDLLLERWRVVVEYDGRHHEVDRGQWARDRRRREALESLGYRVIVVAAADLEAPAQVPWRVHAALVERG